ncbi:hypothetical protein E4O03_11025 [Treponema sp. OMZ 792]|uniref:hypothetical protein n=1 Tax=unclassified Treponema TaxID=2638727 RepID=UPI0020A58DAC|nr:MULTISPECIES: hypothetical protein [unclassified Treponema]UTC74719.1 hypothetical protein E4O03_11025 [Treponema sp. OMZ 792]UTC81113.1 hypothetical protein E4O07_10925 [Treponema sp. OMZ 798]
MKNNSYIHNLKIDDVPWNRLPTTYARATLFPQYFEVLDNMQESDKIEKALDEISINIEHQSTLWYATPFALVFLGRIFIKALNQTEANINADYIVERLLEIFDVIAECCCDGEVLEHPEPLPLFEDMLKEEYLWSEIYNEEDDLLRYEEENVFPGNLFYSFYYYSFEVLTTYREEFAKLKDTKFAEIALYIDRKQNNVFQKFNRT